ncbi:MAG: hypothetical protein HC779_05830 [Phyllobacteriaceae bacterium]|nr:hypothetical protein [Phyllobacteriaceae bacterium]
MTFRNFTPEALNAGRTRRGGMQDTPSEMQRHEMGRGNVNDLSRELDAIAQEISRLKAVRPAQAPQPYPMAPQQPALGTGLGTSAALGVNQFGAMVESLKSDVRNQMRDDLDNQYARLRQELDQLAGALSGTALHGAFRNEIETLASGLDMLSRDNRSIQRGQDELGAYLRSELADLQHALHNVARNDGLERLDQRWNGLEQRWHQLEQKLDGSKLDPAAFGQSVSAALSTSLDRSLEKPRRPMRLNCSAFTSALPICRMAFWPACRPWPMRTPVLPRWSRWKTGCCCWLKASIRWRSTVLAAALPLWRRLMRDLTN